MNWYGPKGVLNWLLWPLSWAYSLTVRLWHALFDLGLRRPVKISGAHVISVGNVVVGGAGKTPVVIHLANEAVRRGFRVAVLSRGYGRNSRDVRSFSAPDFPPAPEVGDEPRLIARRCPQVRVWVGADRVRSAREAVDSGANLLILDDGFQHRRLARDVDVLVDNGHGNGWLLPAGPLREPLSAKKRATHIWGRDGRAGDVQARTRVSKVSSPDGSVISLAEQNVVLLLGVARPDLVQRTVEELGARVVGAHVFADHHPFTPSEVQSAQAEAQRWSALLVTTEKDAERLPPQSAYVLVLELDIIAGEMPLPSASVGGQ